MNSVERSWIWNPTTKTVIYRSKRHHTTKRNFEIFKAPDFIAAALLLPPKGQQTVRYYGIYSNKSRGHPPHPRPHHPAAQTRTRTRKNVALANPPHPRPAQM